MTEKEDDGQTLLFSLDTPITIGTARKSAAGNGVLPPSPATSKRQRGGARMNEHKLTDEQQHALDLFGTGGSLVVEAGAGTGKTSTLVALARSTSRRGQYVAFNRAIVEDAGRKFPATTSCNTAHSLAFRAVGRPFAHRLRDKRMTARSVALALGINDGIVFPGTDGEKKDLSYGFLAGYVLNAVRRFCQSADTELGVKHFRYIDGIDMPEQGKRTYVNNDKLRERMLPYAVKAWDDARLTNGRLTYSHDYYLKLWELSGPIIAADFIMFDEAQDASPVLLSVVEQQRDAQHVFVGDSAQAIYGFTGAIDALQRVDVPHRGQLTQSFRFGPAIADAANVILGRLGTDIRLTGFDQVESLIGRVDRPDACLSRTNAAAVSRFITHKADGGRPHLVGGGKEVLSFARAAIELQAGRRTEHPDLACFKSWGEVQDYVDQDDQGEDLRLMVRLIEKFGAATIVSALDRMPSADKATLVISTAHKAKGLEWGSVELLDDFPVVEEMDADELRLLYVATTRARLRLDNTAIRWRKSEKDED